jgi:hypothetical protein
MPGQQVWITKGTPTAGWTPIDVMERASPDIYTTSTADPSTGTFLAVTARDRFPQAANFKVRVDDEVMLVTAGLGTGAGTFTVVRGQDGTANVAHTSGVVVSLVVGVPRQENVDASRQVSFRGRACSYRTPGRAGSAGQKLFAIHNATASSVVVDVHHIMVDMVQTVVKAVTTLPPLMRVYKFTVVPTSGSGWNLAKNAEDASLTTKSTVTVWGDASSDGGSSATPLAIGAITNGAQAGLITQMFAPRFMGGAGTNPQSELMDRATFFDGEDEIISLRALEGLAIHLDYTAPGQNPITDMWTAAVRWREYAPA